MSNSSCCFESPVTTLGNSQYWVNISVVEISAQESFSVVFASAYHFPPPIAINPKNNQPASCRLMNPSDVDVGSQWTCMGSVASFRIDTSPYNTNPEITQLSTNSSGLCTGKSSCSLVINSSDPSSTTSDNENHQISLGLLGTFDRVPVIICLVLISLGIVIVLLIIWRRNIRKKSKSSEIKTVVNSWIRKPSILSKGSSSALVELSPELPGSKLLKNITAKKSIQKPLVQPNQLKIQSRPAINMTRPNLLQLLPESIYDKKKSIKDQAISSNSFIGSYKPNFKTMPSREPSFAAKKSDNDDDDIPIGILLKK